MNHDAAMKQSISDAIICFETCESTLSKCMEFGKEYSEFGHLQSLIDCARICEVVSEFMLRNSFFHKQICGVCSDICQNCAESCDKYPDQFLKDCAEMCRKCEISCRIMSE